MAVMIVSLAVIFGFKHEITAKLTGFGSHVQIVNPRRQHLLRDRPDLEKTSRSCR